MTDEGMFLLQWHFAAENIRLRCPKFAHLAFARRISTAALAYRSLYRREIIMLCRRIGIADSRWTRCKKYGKNENRPCPALANATPVIRPPVDVSWENAQGAFSGTLQKPLVTALVSGNVRPAPFMASAFLTKGGQGSQPLSKWREFPQNKQRGCIIKDTSYPNLSL